MSLLSASPAASRLPPDASDAHHARTLPVRLQSGRQRLSLLPELGGADPIPTGHTRQLPAGWDYNRPAPVAGELIDNCFSGWDGVAQIDYPDRGLQLTMRMNDCNGLSLMYRPPGLDCFCLEPVTHLIDAFHMPARPGLSDLAPDASMQLVTHFKVSELIP